jgi:hypothetical protein
VQLVETTPLKTILLVLLVILLLPANERRVEVYLIKVTALIFIVALYPPLTIPLIAHALIRGTILFPEALPLDFNLRH